MRSIMASHEPAVAKLLTEATNRSQLFAAPCVVSPKAPSILCLRFRVPTQSIGIICIGPKVPIWGLLYDLSTYYRSTWILKGGPILQAYRTL